MNASCRVLAFGALLAAGTSTMAQETTRVSVGSAGAEGNAFSTGPAISGDGQVVAYFGGASNLVAGDTNATYDVFVFDAAAGTTERVSVDSSGVEGNGHSTDCSISADGRIVAFVSVASNLVPGDTNSASDVFVHDRTTGITERVSVDSFGVEGNGHSAFPAVSADGQIVAFMSSASNLVLGDANGTSDVFVHDRSTGSTIRVSVDSLGAEGNGYSGNPAISADGQIVAVISDATNLVAGDTNGRTDVFIHDFATGLTERVSIDSAGAQGNGGSDNAGISADGRIVVFKSVASNLVAGDTNGTVDVFIHDRVTDLTERVSVDSSGAEGNGLSAGWSISSDGQVIGFRSAASNLVSNDTNGSYDAFVHERSTGLTERVSIDSLGVEGDGDSDFPALSADGKFVAFSSGSTNLVASDTNGFVDVFVHERQAVDATWTNYGSGFSGKYGVPSFTSRSDPVLGTSVTLDLGNSSGTYSIGVLFLGFQRTAIHAGPGGELLVLPFLTSLIALPPSGTTFTGGIPLDPSLFGLALDLQAWESDPGAAKGVSFTQGLELVLGH